MKSSIAQSELLIAILFIGLVSGAVIAQNATNLTNITGDFLANLSGETPENITSDLNLTQIKTIEARETIEIWANSAIELPLERSRFYDNETINLKVALFLDNGETVKGADLDFYLDGNLIGSNSTNSSGQATLIHPLNGLAGKHNLSITFDGMEFINPSQEQAEIEVLPSEIEVIYEAPSGISYNPEIDTISIIGDGKTCTEESPCGLPDIYEADMQGGWGQVSNLSEAYYILDATIVIGDGRNETWFVSDYGEVWINKPWLIRGEASVRFGSSDFPLGCFIDANISEKDLLKRDSAIYTESGGSLYLYNSNFKVYHPTASNNIYFEEDSRLNSSRFSMQNIHDTERIPILYAPEEREIEKMAAVKPNCIDSSDNQACPDLIENEGRFETREDIHESI